MNKKILTYGSVARGLLFVILALIYWTTPAGYLPSYLPGHETGSVTIHFKHGLASIILGLGLFAFAWFESGKKSSQ